MINVAHLVQLKAFARQDALLLALLWAASFACIMMLNAGLIGNILALATPFLVGKRLAAFRTQALYGVYRSAVPTPTRSTCSSTPH